MKTNKISAVCIGICLLIKISPRAYGLGRSIFDDGQTLIKKYDNNFNYKMIAYSELYEKFTTPQNKLDRYTDYTLGTKLNNTDVKDYTDYYEKVLNKIYIDEMNFRLSAAPKADLVVNMQFDTQIDANLEIIFSANNHDLLHYSLDKNKLITHNITFKIPKNLIDTDNRLQLRIKKAALSKNNYLFLDDTHNANATYVGIAIKELLISER